MLQSLLTTTLNWTLGRRKNARPTRRRRPQRPFLQRQVTSAEVLEERALLAAWVSQGPNPVLGAEVENLNDGLSTTLNDDQAVGAISDVVTHPTNANIVYVGTTNGGVWRTNNATSPSPLWTPLTDDLTSLSIGAITIDTVNPSRIITAQGRFSSFNQNGGARNGLLISGDAGQTWVEVDNNRLKNQNFVAVTSRGNVIMAAANAIGGGPLSGGLFRSTDSGSTWFPVSGANGLPTGAVHDLVADPSNINVYYAAVYGSGVYRSEDQGLTWGIISNSDVAIGGIHDSISTATENNNTKLSVSTTGRLYAGVLDAGQLIYLGYTTDGGATWVLMDLPGTQEIVAGSSTGVGVTPVTAVPGDDGAYHFSMVVDPFNEDIIYIGGTEQEGTVTTGNSIGAMDRSGRLFRGDASISAAGVGVIPSPQWDHLTHRNDSGSSPTGGTRNSSSPFAGSRNMTVNSNGDLLEVDNGGIYLRSSPTTNLGDWVSKNGNLSVAEIVNVGYDSRNNIILASSNDLGTVQQSIEGSQIWESVQFRPASDVGVDAFSTAGRSIRYRLAGDELVSTEYDSINQLVGLEQRNDIFLAASPGAGVTPQLVVNSVDTTRVLFTHSDSPTAGLAYTADRGVTVTPLDPVAPIPTLNTLVYGGQRFGTNNPDLLLYASADQLFMTTDMMTPVQVMGLTGNRILTGVAVNPANFDTIYVSDNRSVYQSVDQGATFTDITGNLADIGITNISTLTYVSGNPHDGIIVTTEEGVYVTTQALIGTWREMGTGLPNAPITDTYYDASDDVFIVSTLGRGVWTFPFVNNELNVLAVPVMQSPNSQVDSGRPEFRWSGVTNAVAYELLITDATTGAEILRQSVNRTNFTPTSPLAEGDYRVSVRSQNLRGDFSVQSNILPFRIDVPTPPAPAFLAPEATTGSSTPVFEWNAVNFANVYEFSVFNSSGERVIIKRDLDTTTYQHFTGLVQGDYQARVQAFNDVGEGSAFGILDFTVDVELPAKPELIGPLDQATVETIHPKFEWTGVTGATEYDLFVIDETNGVNPFYRNTRITSIVHTPAISFPQGRYKWYVQALNEAREGSGFIGPYFFDLDVPTPAKTRIRLPQVTTEELRPRMVWTASDHAVRYDLWVNQLGANGQVTARQVIREPFLTSIEYTPTFDLTPATYRMYVKAVNEAREGIWSDVREFTVAPTLPPAPTVTGPAVNAVRATDDLTPLFSWTDVGAVGGYELWVRKVQPDSSARGFSIVQSPFLRVRPVNGLSYQATSDFQVGHYQVYVRGLNAAGARGALSPRFDFELAVDTPTVPVILQPAAGLVNSQFPVLEWTPVNNAVTYHVYLRQLSTGQVILNSTNVTGTFLALNTSLPTGSYQFWVRAFNVGGQTGGWSIPRSFVVASNDRAPALWLPSDSNGDITSPEEIVEPKTAEPISVNDVPVVVAALDRDDDHEAVPAPAPAKQSVGFAPMTPAQMAEAETESQEELEFILAASDDALEAVMSSWHETEWWIDMDDVSMETESVERTDGVAVASVLAGTPLIFGRAAARRQRRRDEKPELQEN